MNEEEIIIDPAEEYITAPGISYSALSRLADGPRQYVEKDRPTGDFLSSGSAVDILLTEGEEEFHKKFFVMPESKPSSDMMVAYVENMLATDNHALALIASGYKSDPIIPTKKDPNGPTKWEKEGKPYYEAVKSAGNRSVLGMEQYMQINAVVNQLRNNEFTKDFFPTVMDPDKEIQYQFIHYFEYKGRAAKIKLDIVGIDHKDKIIYPKDLKTTGKSVFAFISSYRSYKYYLQGGLFMLGLEDWRKENYPDYKLDNFEFIVAEMTTNNPPLIYRMTSHEIAQAIVGGESVTGHKYKGINQLLTDLTYYETFNRWDYPAEIDRDNGVIELGLFS